MIPILYTNGEPMAKTVNLDSDYEDVLLDERGNLSIAEDARETVLSVVQLLRTVRGEWNQDVTLGLPFESELRQGIIDANVAPGIVESTILSVDGVQSVDVERIEIENRVMTLDIQVETSTGQLIAIERLQLHPSDSGESNIIIGRVLTWLNNPITWLGNYIAWNEKVP